MDPTPASQRKAPKNGDSAKWGMHNMRPKSDRRRKTNRRLKTHLEKLWNWKGTKRINDRRNSRNNSRKHIRTGMATTTRSITNGCKDIRERREEKQDPQTPDIPNTFMHTEREEVMMEGKEGVKAHNIVGGERKIDRSRKAKIHMYGAGQKYKEKQENGYWVVYSTQKRNNKEHKRQNKP